jgi:hypothetical protein
MDIYCPTCGEPWDMDELHDAYVEGRKLAYAEARQRFFLNNPQRNGCTVFGATHNAVADTRRATISTVLAEILGDDVDAIAALSEDADLFD